MPRKYLIRTCIFLISGFALFFLLLLIASFSTSQGKGTLDFCSPIYNVAFHGIEFLKLVLNHLLGIIILTGVVLFFLLGLFSICRKDKATGKIGFIFFSLSLAIIGYGFLIHGFEAIGLIFMLGSLIGIAFAAMANPILEDLGRKGNIRWHIVGFGLIMIFTACNCFYHLENIPYHLSAWEVGGGLSALQLSPPAHPDYHRYLWSSLDRPYDGVALCPFSVYLLWGLFKIFGVSLLMLRSAGVFWGLTSLVILYFLIRYLFGARTALLTVFFTSISPWFLSIARLGSFINISLCFFLLVLLVFYRALKGKMVYFIIAGGLLSLFRYFYIPVKILFPFMALAWLYHWIFNTRSRKIITAGPLLLLVGFILVSLLLGVPVPRLTGTANAHIFLGITGGNSGFSLIRTLIDLRNNSYALFYNLFYRNHSIVFAAPGGLLVDRASLLMAFLGLGWALGRWRREKYFFLVLGLSLSFLPIIVTTSLPGGFPVAQRCFLAVPFIALSAAIMLSIIINALRIIWKKPGSVVGKFLILICLIFIAVLNIHNYFHIPTHPNFSVKRSFAEHCLRRLKEGYFLEIAESDHHSRELIEFMAYPLTQDIYTYFAFYPYADYRKTGRMEEGLNYHPTKINPYYHFWETDKFQNVLSTVGERQGKTAIIFENEMPYENRHFLAGIKSSNPRSKIIELKDPAGRVIGFQVLMDN